MKAFSEPHLNYPTITRGWYSLKERSSNALFRDGRRRHRGNSRKSKVVHLL